MEQFPQWDGDKMRQLVMVFESTDRSNVLTAERLDTMSAFHRTLLTTVSEDEEYGASYYDVCFKLPEIMGSQNGTLASAPCFVYSYLEFWPPQCAPARTPPPGGCQFVTSRS
jgi:hypothetical protein